ncbi:MAG: sensor histidine kinase [Chitinophagales bacterium]
MLKKFTLNLILGIALLCAASVAVLLYRHAEKINEPEVSARRIEVEFQNLEKKIIATISDSVIISNLITDSYTFNEFSSLVDKPFGMIIYQEDSAVIWTNNFITPVKAQLVYNDAPLFISESNGEYVIYQHDFPGNVHVIGFLPLQFEFGIKNKYLNHVKTPGIQIPEHLKLKARSEPDAYAVHSLNGNEIFYIAEDDNIQNVVIYSKGMYFFICCTFILLLITCFGIAKSAINKFNRIASTGFLLVLLAGVYLLTNYLLYDHILSYLPLFDPQYYGSPGIADSTGDLLIKTALLFCFALFFSKYFRIRLPDGKGATFNLLLLVSMAVIICCCSLLTGNIFRSLIIDSSISFNIHNFFSLNYFSFIGFLCISILLLSYFFIISRCVEIIVKNIQRKFFFSLIVIATGIAVLIVQRLLNHAMQIDMIIFVAGFVIIREFLIARRISTRSLGGMMIWLIYFSAFSAYIFNSSLDHKVEETKRLFAIKKSIEKDPITEYLFKEHQVNIQKQLSAQGVSLETEEKIRPGIINQIRQDLQSNYFKKYNTDIFIFRNDSLLLFTGDDNINSRLIFIDAIENNGEFTAAENLYFINDYTGSYYYLAELPVSRDSVGDFTAYLKMVPKKFSGESIYPELLIDDDLRTAESFINFDYAIYSDHTLSEREGEYSYPLMDIFYINKDEEVLDIIQNDYDHYIYKVNETKKVVVSTPMQSWFEPVSIFSYLFFFYLVFLVIILSLDIITRIAQGNIVLTDWINTSLQNKIQTSVISLIIFAFIMMGVATIYYISNQYNFSHKQRLLNKIEAVQTNIDFLIGETRKKGNRVVTNQQLKKIGNRVTELSEIHDMDINIYKPSGDLMSSSQPDIFEKGLVSKKMNSLAYFKMSCDKETWYIQTENIGDLSFLSAYVPVLDDSGETMFYLNLPYFATEQNLRTEISSFMVTLVNVYVLLLIVAGIIAYIVSRSITSPLATIAGKFKGIKLGKMNEPIRWTHEDEIGLLVAEYNKMLKELENSAELLAKSERESAWRDMAKQVAHEIKNPLTPMRLSIQHLQRAIQTNAPNVKELMRKVSDTLLEQIDNLSNIASEFSTFAIMPKAVNETINLNDLLESVTALFIENDEAELTLQIPQEQIEVFADKNQLLRVFNNVIKNAIQSIPDERAGEILITLQHIDHRALIKVKDNGVGITDEEKDKVFVPNFTTKSSGMGIGLAMSKNIVESTGGYIWFESTVDSGTTFYIEFPVIQN